MIRGPRAGDAEAICRIYNHYVENTIVTFATDPVPEAEMAVAIVSATARFPWLVWEEEGELRGYATASEWKSRCAYRYSVETTIYLDPEAGGRGIGTRLYGELLAHVRKAGHLKEVGRKFGQWIDVGYWQKIFR